MVLEWCTVFLSYRNRITTQVWTLTAAGIVCEICQGSLVHLEDLCDREANPKICYLMKLQGHAVVITSENACNRVARWHKPPCK